jgi:hypothetical protein
MIASAPACGWSQPVPDRFPVALPLHAAYSRRLLCAAELVDGVTLDRVRQGVTVSARGLQHKPVVNAGGFFVWLEEGGAAPTRILVDASDTVYADADSAPPAPPAKSVRIELAPRFAYPFPPGATALRGTLRVSRFGPPEPVAGATLRLQWDDGTGWVDAPVAVTSEPSGDFAAPLRLSPRAEPRMLPGGGLAVRLRVTRGGMSRTSDEFALAAGRVGSRDQPFIWDDLNP